MYVKIKFLEDGKKNVLHEALVKNFRPSNVADFNKKQTYQVFWEGDDNTRGGYYDAQILKLTGKCDMRNSISLFQKRDIAHSNIRPPFCFDRCDKLKVQWKS